jgi:hypothetical protein
MKYFYATFISLGSENRVKSSGIFVNSVSPVLTPIQ